MQQNMSHETVHHLVGVMLDNDRLIRGLSATARAAYTRRCGLMETIKERGLEHTRDRMDRCSTTEYQLYRFKIGESKHRDNCQFCREEAINGAPMVIRGS